LNKINPNRWQQRFTNYQSALVELNEAVNQTSLNKLEKQGLIKAFEYTFELAWKTLQDYIQCIGITDIVGPRPDSTAHVYNKNFADHLVEEIRKNHIKLLIQLENSFKLKSK
jgi:hypothetical protein